MEKTRPAAFVWTEVIKTHCEQDGYYRSRRGKALYTKEPSRQPQTENQTPRPEKPGWAPPQTEDRKKDPAEVVSWHAPPPRLDRTSWTCSETLGNAPLTL